MVEFRGHGHPVPLVFDDEYYFSIENIDLGNILIKEQTDSYTLVLEDASCLIDMNCSGANNLTIPPDSEVAFPSGTRLAVRQKGEGQTTIAAGSGVTVNSADDAYDLNGQYAMVMIIKITTDIWTIEGNLTTV